MRYLVAGGAGFLGSHVCDRLLSMGHAVVCVDNFLTGVPNNIKHLADDKRVDFITQDVSHPFEVKGRIDGVLHLATPASPLAYQKHPVDTLKAGAFGTFNLLECAREHNARFLLTSTSEVYGDPEIHPQHEDYHGRVSPTGPRSMYDESKRYSEAVTFSYLRAYETNVGIVRIFNTYGPRMRPDDGRVVASFISQALKQEPLTLFGDGSKTRSFCYVDDLVEGLTTMLLSDVNGPINLGNPGEVTMLDLATQVIEITNSQSRIEFLPAREDDPVRRCPDITRAGEQLNWSPKTTLSDGLEKTSTWIKAQLQYS